MSVLTKSYDQLKGNLEYPFTEDEPSLTINKIKNQLRVIYTSIGKENNQRIGLTMTKQFKGLCHHCGKRGHQKRTCWALEENHHLRPNDWSKGDNNDGYKSHSRKTHKTCKWCKKTNHAEDNCRYKKNDQAIHPSGSLGCVFGTVLMTSRSSYNYPDEWIGDTGATHHISRSKKNMYNTVHTKETIKMGNGQKDTCELTGDLDIEYKNQDGKKHIVTLKNVNYVPTFWCNLFSMTSAMAQGIDLIGSGKSLLLKDKTGKRENIEFYKILRDMIPL